MHSTPPSPEAMPEFQAQRVETIPEAGLTILRGALPPDQARAVAAELKEIMDSVEREPHEGDAGKNAHQNINQARFASDLIVREGFSAITGVLEQLGAARGHQVVINHQKPHGVQKFHADDNGVVEVSETSPLFVIQGSDGGFLDYSPGTTVFDGDDAAENNAVSIPVHAGDVIVQTNPDLIHRGRNGTNHDRYNLVVFSERKPLSLEEAIKESQAQAWE